MSNLTEEERRRIGALRNAVYAGSMDKVAPARTDIALLAKRLNELELEEHSCAEELVKWLRGRVAEELKSQQGWLEDCIEQARTAELMVLEARRSLSAIDALLAGDMWADNQAALDRWADLEGDLMERGLLLTPAEVVAPPPPDPEPEPAPEPSPSPSPSPEPLTATAPPLPAELVAQLTKAGQKAHAGVGASPGDTTIPPPRVRGPLSKTEPGDPLTDKQAAVFRAILSAAGPDWIAKISQGRIAKVSRIAAGGASAHIDALERKDYIRVIDRGNSMTPGTYLVCERARPARVEVPKTDAELIEEALKAGKVTVCPPAFAAPTNVH